MKQKIVLCSLVLLFTVSGCFALVESSLGWLCKDKPVKEKEDAPGAITFIQGPRYKPPFVYHYQYQSTPRWWYYWWVDTGGRIWWLDYNYAPEFWPKPKFTVERRRMIPRDTKGGIDRYVDSGVPTGSFLRAVLSNDLFEAIARADEYNKLALTAICEYIYNYTPNTCYGSPEKVEAWIKYHRESPKEANRAAGMDREQREAYYGEVKP